METRQYVADLIGDSYKHWNNDTIILDCGTGSGKTFFCIDILGKYAKEQGKTIRIFYNRKALGEEYSRKIDRLGLNEVIKIQTYQALENTLRIALSVSFSEDYLIIDEAHYFTLDAEFNPYTDLSFHCIMGCVGKSNIIFASATAQMFFDNLRHYKKIVSDQNYYYMERDYSYVDNLYFYKKNDLGACLDYILNNDNDSKIVVFFHSTKRLLEYKNKYPEALVYCSEHSKNEKLLKARSNNCFQNNTFNARLLFTTSALDNGYDLKDRKIKYIFSELMIPDSVIQSFGRKRKLDKDDHCNFYVYEYTKRGLNKFIRDLSKEIEYGKEYNKNQDDFNMRYSKDREFINLKTHIFYNNRHTGKIEMNQLRFTNAVILKKQYQKMLKDGYKSTILRAFCPKSGDNFIDFVKLKFRKDTPMEKKELFLAALSQLENRPLYKDDQKALHDLFKSIGCVAKYKGTGKNALHTFNGALEDVYGASYPFRFTNIDPKTGKELRDTNRKLESGEDNPNRNKRYWMLVVPGTS